MSRYGLEIRAASAADAAALAELLRAGDEVVDPGVLADRIKAMRRQSGGVLLAWEWGPPSGVIAFGRLATLQDAGQTAVVTYLFVAPDSRRRGVARLLLKAAAQGARQGGCDTMLVAVGEGRPELQAFLTATGFTREGFVFTRSLRKKG